MDYHILATRLRGWFVGNEYGKTHDLLAEAADTIEALIAERDKARECLACHHSYSIHACPAVMDDLRAENARLREAIQWMGNIKHCAQLTRRVWALETLTPIQQEPKP